MTKQVFVKGTITCAPEDLEMLKTAVQSHINLTIAEPGCIQFSITQDDTDPCTFIVDESFVDRAAFDLHTKRTRASKWWEMTKHIPRNLEIT